MTEYSDINGTIFGASVFVSLELKVITLGGSRYSWAPALGAWLRNLSF